MKSGGDEFYSQMATLANEDFDSEEVVCILSTSIFCRRIMW